MNDSTISIVSKTSSLTKKEIIANLKKKLDKYKNDNEFLMKRLSEASEQLRLINESVQQNQTVYNEMCENFKFLNKKKYTNHEIESEVTVNTAQTAMDSNSEKINYIEKINKFEGIIEYITNKYRILKEKYNQLKSEYAIMENKLVIQEEEIIALTKKNTNLLLHDKCSNKKIELLKLMNECIIRSCVYNIPGNNYNSWQYISELPSLNDDEKAETFLEPVPTMLTFLSKYS